VRRGFAHAHQFTLRNRNADYLVRAAIHAVTVNFDFQFGSITSGSGKALFAAARLNLRTDLRRG